MRIPEFVTLAPSGRGALELAEREVARPQPPGTLLRELADLIAESRVLRSRLADAALSPAERSETEQQQQEVLIALAVREEDLVRDPGGYLAWFWAEGNQALLRKTEAFPQ